MFRQTLRLCLYMKNLCKEVLLEQCNCPAIRIIVTSQARDCILITYRRNYRRKDKLLLIHIKSLHRLISLVPFPCNLCMECMDLFCPSI